MGVTRGAPWPDVSELQCAVCGAQRRVARYSYSTTTTPHHHHHTTPPPHNHTTTTPPPPPHHSYRDGLRHTVENYRLNTGLCQTLHYHIITTTSPPHHHTITSTTTSTSTPGHTPHALHTTHGPCSIDAVPLAGHHGGGDQVTRDQAD